MAVLSVLEQATPGITGLAKPGSLQNLRLIDVLTKIATDCKLTADRLAKRFVRRRGVYFRLNVTHRAGEVSLDEWVKMGEVQTHTKSYMAGPLVSDAIDDVVGLLCMTQANILHIAGGRPTLAGICTLYPESFPSCCIVS